MNNPFATVPTPAAQQPTLQANPFAPQAPVQPPSFPMAPTSAPTANPFAAVVQQAPPVQVPAPPTQGVAAIQAAFAFPAAMAAAPTFPPLNPPGEAGLGLQPVAAPAPAQVEAPAAPVAPEPVTKARRSRKAKADAAPVTAANAFEVRTDPGPDLDADGADCRNYATHPLVDAGYSPANEAAMRYGVQPTLDSATTEELRDALNARGWNVTLVAS